MSLHKPELAVPHLQTATRLRPDDDVAWYRLARAEAALGNEEDQKKALAEFQRLKSQKSIPQEASKRLFSPHEVTKQEVDSAAPQ
jgi:predicted Zn-dependent protease